ncbi:hypothetical protein J8F10_27505 [Gemmata sp. G18]|uniref:Uncharacterized protein n=1 Tax=Gemmata palustris TaxID=2822762 RepID=A0ABS5C046_9BACT|nr:hypothetical protein [Gemmata palustris]MBP3959007.1 hypothetical protein [Gemmata palustris]
MNLLVAWKKVLLFGAFGAVGCLAGGLAGEPLVWASRSVAEAAGAKDAPSLISRPAPQVAEPPPLPNDIRERVERAGGKSGDVQLSLIWHNANDLDLYCKDPNGDIVFYKNPRVPSGGELDVDANAGNRRNGLPTVLTNEPVENIYWPKGAAPAGHYQVFINYFAHRPATGAPNETPYKVNILRDGQRYEFKGTIEYGGTQRNERLIDEFDLKPLEVLAPDEVSLHPTAPAIKLPVAVRRIHYKGPVEVRVENLPEGVVAGKLTIPEGENEGEIELRAVKGAKAIKKTALKLVATGGNLDSSVDVQLTPPKPVAAFSLLGVLSTGAWTALLAVGLCLALLAGQNKYLGKPLFASSRVSLLLVIFGAMAAGFVSGSIGQSLFFVLLAAGVANFGFLIGWVLLGALLGWGVSRFVPNLDGVKAALAGLGGGLLGAGAFLLLSELAQWTGRFGGAALLGFCIGLMVAVVEAAFRRAWLEVRFGEREVITVNLGTEPVKVGSDARACTVWARGAAPVALEYWIRDGRVQCADVPAKQETIAADGDTRAVGSVTVVVRTSSAVAPAGGDVRPTVARPTAPAVPITAPHPEPVGAVPPVPAQTARSDYDDGLPMPMSPPPPVRPAVTSILDTDDGFPAPTTKSTSTPTAAPNITAAPVPATSQRPAPVSPPKVSDPDACPTCGRKVPGRTGARYCMVCDRAF